MFVHEWLIALLVLFQHEKYTSQLQMTLKPSEERRLGEADGDVAEPQRSTEQKAISGKDAGSAVVVLYHRRGLHCDGLFMLWCFHLIGELCSPSVAMGIPPGSLVSPRHNPS